ncbi:MAG: hypothetical protein ACO3JL_03175 [Myxococcota bacterium]
MNRSLALAVIVVALSSPLQAQPSAPTAETAAAPSDTPPSPEPASPAEVPAPLPEAESTTQEIAAPHATTSEASTTTLLPAAASEDQSAPGATTRGCKRGRCGAWHERRLFQPYPWLSMRGVAEVGSLAVLFHTLQFGSNGTQLDYLVDGGQDNLFPFLRLSAEAELFRHHTLVLLYQPLDLRTTALLSRDLIIDDALFPSGTPMSYRYGFDFVRGSYLFDFFGDPDTELALGLSFQVRNATIDFASKDGTLFRSERDIGPVPILKARGRYTFDGGLYTAFEVDGFWASGRVITGTANDFEGAIYDASVRLGVPLVGFANTFVNLRFLGGGARGVEEDDPGPGDGFTDNWLHTAALSLGFELH